VATPGELVKTVSTALDLPEVTVSIYYRNLREAGLVTKGGRGPSAPSLTYLDASRLVISLMGTDTAIHAAREAKRYGRLPLTHLDKPAGDDVYPGFSSELFSRLNFESAVEYVLEIASVEHEEELITDEMYPLVISAKSDLSAEIRFWLHGYYDKLPSDWMKAETGALVSPSRILREERMPQGFLVQRSIGGIPLVQIARCIRS